MKDAERGTSFSLSAPLMPEFLYTPYFRSPFVPCARAATLCVSPCVSEFTRLFPHPFSILWRVCPCFSASSNMRSLSFSLCAPLCLLCPSSLPLLSSLVSRETLFLVRYSAKYRGTACRFFSIPFHALFSSVPRYVQKFVELIFQMPLETTLRL